jgi:hypothetical protein
MSIKTPASMEYTSAIETYTLYGKSILKYTKKESSAFIIWLFKRQEESNIEKDRQREVLISLRKSKRL